MIKKIGIIGAMEEEVEALRGKLTYVKTTSRASMDFYAGKMDKGSYKGFSGRLRQLCTERRRGEHAASAYDGRMCVEGEACIYRKGNPCISGKYGTFYDL